MNEHSIPTQPVSRVISERGVLLPLMAFIILGIFAIIIILGVDSYVVKYAAMSLRGQANDICGHLAKGIVSARKDTAKTFVAQVNAIAASMPSLTTLYSAHLISPTMPEEQIFPADLNGFTGGSGSIVNEHASNPPFLSGSGGLDLCGSGALLEGEPECVEFCASTGKCIYEGDILPTNVESPAPF
ncbi:MAG: hypothetical protein J0M12_13460, partial [Deltaproteobacteria bacterium]|nr:hypothetical protein [Deltaproteobacteria bacterium]